MKKILSLLIFALLCFSSRAATFNSYTITFTNSTANGYTNVINGVQSEWTNAPINPSQWITTGSSNASATNFFNFLGANFSQYIIAQTSSNVVTFQGIGATLGIVGPFGYVVTNNTTALNTNQISNTRPIDNLASTTQVWQASDTVYGAKYSTNPFAPDIVALTNYAGLNSTQKLANKTLTSPILNNPTNTGGLYSNAVYVNVGLIYATNGTLLAAQIFNAVVTNAVLSGVTWIDAGGGVLSNITYTKSFITNAHSIETTNLVAYGGGYLSRISLDNCISTNMLGSLLDVKLFNTGATGPGHFILVTNYDSTGQSEITFDNGYDYAFGNETFDGFIFQIKGNLVGDFAVSTNTIYIQAFGGVSIISGSKSDSTITLGDPSYILNSASPLVSGSYSNSTFRGTNQFNGEVSNLPRTYSTAISGYASAINLATNTYIRITGASAAVTNASFTGGYSGRHVHVEVVNPGLSCVILHRSSIGSPPSTDQINTGTGGLINMTNNPAVFDLDHNGTEWILANPSR